MHGIDGGHKRQAARRSRVAWNLRIQEVQHLGDGHGTGFGLVDRHPIDGQQNELADPWRLVRDVQPWQRRLQQPHAVTAGEQLADHVHIVNIASRAVGGLDVDALASERVLHREKLRPGHQVHLMLPSGIRSVNTSDLPGTEFDTSRDPRNSPYPTCRLVRHAN